MGRSITMVLIVKSTVREMNGGAQVDAVAIEAECDREGARQAKLVGVVQKPIALLMTTATTKRSMMKKDKTTMRHAAMSHERMERSSG
jgi:hypothetical protein